MQKWGKLKWWKVSSSSFKNVLVSLRYLTNIVENLVRTHLESIAQCIYSVPHNTVHIQRISTLHILLGKKSAQLKLSNLLSSS